MGSQQQHQAPQNMSDSQISVRTTYFIKSSLDTSLEFVILHIQAHAKGASPAFAFWRRHQGVANFR